MNTQRVVLEPKEHSDFGASGTERWFNCPGSIAEQKNYPPQKAGLPAAWGTAAHWLAEQALNNRYDIKQLKEYIGFVIATDGYEISVDQEMVNCVSDYVFYIWMEYHQTCKELGMSPTYANVYSEETYHLTEIDDRLWGSNDACLVFPFYKLCTYDLKTGKGKLVTAQDNTQLLFYALGAILKHGTDFETVELNICQPRWHDGSQRFTKWTVTVPEVLAYGEKLKQALANATEANAKLVPGEWCKYCLADGACRGQRESVEAIVSSVTAPILPPVVGMSPVEVAKYLQTADVIEQWISGVRNYARALAVEQGVKVPGYKVVKSFGNRSWVDETVAMKKLFVKYGADIYAEPKLLSPAQMEKKFKNKTEVEELVQRKETGMDLVKESDKREEFKINASNVYDLFDATEE